jgi:DNA-binding transcriptional MerR regulator
MEGTDVLTVANAARHAGVSASTIRRWMDGGNLESRTTSQGHRITSKEALMRCLSRHSHTPQRAVGGATARHSHDTPTREAVVGSHARMEGEGDALRIALEALTHERRVSEDLRIQNRELQSQLVKLAAEMHALLSRETDGKLSRWFRR